MHVTRLAPSPTGALHLGNARTFLANWLMARQAGWQIHLRIEDLDGPRAKSGADQLILEDLIFLGLDWDTGPTFQLNQLPVYQRAIDQLIAGGFVYPCTCTRKEIESAASAPHAEDGSVIYPGTCRGRYRNIEDARQATGRTPALRFTVPDRAFEFTDQFAGSQRFDLATQIGDFVVAKPDGTPSYQLAVVLDDHAQQIDTVVRGDDLLDSVPRQALLYEALGWSSAVPQYFHLPLVVGTDGRRLAKRHGDTRVALYRELGVSRGRLLRLLARWLGIEVAADTIDASDLIAAFDLRRIPKTPIVFTADDDAFLRG